MKKRNIVHSHNQIKFAADPISIFVPLQHMLLAEPSATLFTVPVPMWVHKTW